MRRTLLSLAVALAPLALVHADDHDGYKEYAKRLREHQKRQKKFFKEEEKRQAEYFRELAKWEKERFKGKGKGKHPYGRTYPLPPDYPDYPGGARPFVPPPYNQPEYAEPLPGYPGGAGPLAPPPPGPRIGHPGEQPRYREPEWLPHPRHPERASPLPYPAPGGPRRMPRSDDD
jgi:hypothetical protein